MKKLWMIVLALLLVLPLAPLMSNAYQDFEKDDDEQINNKFSTFVGQDEIDNMDAEEPEQVEEPEPETFD